MSKILEVIIKFDDYTLKISGEEAEKWYNHNLNVAEIAKIHDCNPFDKDPIKWKKYLNSENN